MLRLFDFFQREFETAENQCPEDRYKTQASKKENENGDDDDFYVMEDTAKFIRWNH